MYRALLILFLSHANASHLRGQDEVFTPMTTVGTQYIVNPVKPSELSKYDCVANAKGKPFVVSGFLQDAAVLGKRVLPWNPASESGMVDIAARNTVSQLLAYVVKEGNQFDSQKPNLEIGLHIALYRIACRPPPPPKPWFWQRSGP
jgi:hypothetical protein